MFHRRCAIPKLEPGREGDSEHGSVLSTPDEFTLPAAPVGNGLARVKQNRHRARKQTMMGSTPGPDD